jgi:hypothetical protein
MIDDRFIWFFISVRSSEFKKMLESPTLRYNKDKDGPTLLVEDISGDTMEMCLRFMYGASVDSITTKSADAASEVICAADKVKYHISVLC